MSKNQSPEQNQVDAMESNICLSVLNMVSLKKESEVKHVLVKADLVNNQSECFIDGVAANVNEFASIEQFEQSLKPCILGESKEAGISAEGFELEIGDKKIRLEVFGMKGDVPTSHIIPVIQVMHYAR